MVSKIFR